MVSSEQAHPYFEPDEYTAINTRYFADIRRRRQVAIDPSGWIDTLSEAGQIELPPGPKLPLGRYYMDEGDALGNVRTDLHQLLETWEGTEFDPTCFTACPSVGSASLLTMAVLSRRNVRRIVFETPCYFAAILQAECLGFDVVLAPTYRHKKYQRPVKYERPIKGQPTVWWLTHPRVTLGFDQDVALLQAMVGRIGIGDFIVIDEALDQSFPSQLSQTLRINHEPRIVRLKSFGKPLGLNGYRLAFILHHPTLRYDMIDCLETYAGAIDAKSLEAACAVASEPKHFRAMMQVANHQVVALRVAAERLAAHTDVFINPLTNGYLGSAVVNCAALGPDQVTRRHRLLLGCKRRRMPVIVGPSMHFASDPPTEAIRLNFFSKREHILLAVEALAEIAKGVT